MRHTSMNGKKLRHLLGNSVRYSCPHVSVFDWLYWLFYVIGSQVNERCERAFLLSFYLLNDFLIHGICQTGCLCRGSTSLNRHGLSAMTRLSLRITRRGQKTRDIPPQSCLLQSFARRGLHGMESTCCRPTSPA
jgi:hypothetical protein